MPVQFSVLRNMCSMHQNFRGKVMKKTAKVVDTDKSPAVQNLLPNIAPSNDNSTSKDSKMPNSDAPKADPVDYAQKLVQIGQKGRQILETILELQAANPKEKPLFVDPFNMAGAFFEASMRMVSDPKVMLQTQADFWGEYSELVFQTTRRFMGEDSLDVIGAPKGDKRFSEPEWQDSTYFDFIRQAYLLTSKWTKSMVETVDGLDDKSAQKIQFYTQQFLDFWAPSNFVLTNPKVLKTTIETGGQNLVKGMENLLEDIRRGGGSLAVSMTDHTAFEVGENLATTKGYVVYQNDLMQLIQYTPQTKTVYETPLLVIPPWINKYYILDLQEKNSFTNWVVGQGYTTFMISWVNPDKTLAGKSFESYMKEGILDAVAQIEKITGQKQINALGYCIGGTLLATTLAHLRVLGKSPIRSASYMTAMVDFADSGEINVFIDEQQLVVLEAMMSETGYLDARSMQAGFNMLRANDLIWSFVINNYLLGQEPFPFDLLYWNADSVHLAAAAQSFYLRNMYKDNLLKQPNTLTLGGTPIDVTAIDTPTFAMAAEKDHIAPWHCVYRSAKLYKGDVEFVLAASGHVAGVVNPPNANKYCYWTNPAMPAGHDDWREESIQHDGSWWTHWDVWLQKHSGKQVKSSEAGRALAEATKYALEPAPGSYVKAKAV